MKSSIDRALDKARKAESISERTSAWTKACAAYQKSHTPKDLVAALECAKALKAAGGHPRLGDLR